MASVNIYDAKTNLSRLITRVEAGEEIIISRNGRAVARPAPISARETERLPGALAGRLRVRRTSTASTNPTPPTGTAREAAARHPRAAVVARGRSGAA